MDKFQTNEELFGTYYTNPPKMFTLNNVFDYVRELKELKDRFVLEIMSTDDENRRNELAQEIHMELSRNVQSENSPVKVLSATGGRPPSLKLLILWVL